LKQVWTARNKYKESCIVDGEHSPSLGEDKAGSERDHNSSVESRVYAIKIKGHLDHDWSEWLDHLTISHEEDGTTVLTGPVSDPPAMYGLLIKLRDLGLSLISVNCGECDDEDV
jgi:hypothetical protein